MAEGPNRREVVPDTVYRVKPSRYDQPDRVINETFPIHTIEAPNIKPLAKLDEETLLRVEGSLSGIGPS